MQLVHQHALDELSGRPSRHLRAERKDTHLVGTVLAQQLHTTLQRRQLAWLSIGSHHGHRVRIERDRHNGRAIRELAGAVEDVLVTAVHAVERADRDCGW